LATAIGAPVRPASGGTAHRVGRIPIAGKLLKQLVPVANYAGILPLTESQLRQWALLDTFDWLSPAYDNPQTAAMARHWFTQAGFKVIEALKAGHMVGPEC
jgi:hypothetical protein